MLGNSDRISDLISLASSSITQYCGSQELCESEQKQTNIKTTADPLWRRGNLVNDLFPRTLTKIFFKAKNGLSLAKITAHFKVDAMSHKYLEFD